MYRNSLFLKWVDFWNKMQKFLSIRVHDLIAQLACWNILIEYLYTAHTVHAKWDKSRRLSEYRNFILLKQANVYITYHTISGLRADL